MIKANDTLTAYVLGSVASTDHREAIRLHADAVRTLGDSSQREVLKRALDERSAFGYLGIGMSKARAEHALRDAARFFEWVRRVLPASMRP